METLHEIIIGLLTNAIWALGGFLIAFFFKKTSKVSNKRLSTSPLLINSMPSEILQGSNSDKKKPYCVEKL
jgi:hypothetical protein